MHYVIYSEQHNYGLRSWMQKRRELKKKQGLLGLVKKKDGWYNWKGKKVAEL